MTLLLIIGGALFALFLLCVLCAVILSGRLDDAEDYGTDETED